MSEFVITGIEHASPKSKRLRIHIEGASDLCVYARELKRLGWSEGDSITEEEYDSFIEEVLIPRAKSRALHLLEKYDRTASELSSKLREGGYPDTAISAAVEYASEYGYIDDERYARNYIFFHKEGRSRRRLLNDLQKKGIDKELAASILEEEYDSDEIEMIRSLLAKKRYDPSDTDPKHRLKLYRHLASKGFSSSDIKTAMDGYSAI